MRESPSSFQLRRRAALVPLCGVLLLALAAAAVEPPMNSQQGMKDAAATQPASRPGDPNLPPAQPTAEDVLKALQSSSGSQGRPVVLPDLPGGMRRETMDPASGMPAVQQRLGRLLPEGYRLVERPGRMVKSDETSWTFVFEERGMGKPEQPMRLLPNRLLEQMEIASAGGTQSVVFIVSGDVTEYRAANYLLVQKLLIRPNLGNLK